MLFLITSLPDDCTVLDHHPETCSCCGEKLTGVDASPYRHQVVDIPPIKPIVVEHRLHQLVCDNCGTRTRAKLPLGVNPSGYETRVVALVAVLSGAYRHSQRMVQSAMSEVFGIPMYAGYGQQTEARGKLGTRKCGRILSVHVGKF